MVVQAGMTLRTARWVTRLAGATAEREVAPQRRLAGCVPIQWEFLAPLARFPDASHHAEANGRPSRSDRPADETRLAVGIRIALVPAADVASQPGVSHTGERRLAIFQLEARSLVRGQEPACVRGEHGPGCRLALEVGPEPPIPGTTHPERECHGESEGNGGVNLHLESTHCGSPSGLGS